MVFESLCCLRSLALKVVNIVFLSVLNIGAVDSMPNGTLGILANLFSARKASICRFLRPHREDLIPRRS